MTTLNDPQPRPGNALTDVPEEALNARWNAFYRSYPWMQHRLSALLDLLYPSTDPGTAPCVTLEGPALHDARALLIDLQAHLDRCYAPKQHQAFRANQRQQPKKKGQAHAPTE